MSNFVIAVGGSGAKLMQTLIHLGACGLLPDARREIDAILVDPDENNGNVDDCQQLEHAYQLCQELQLGNTDLFSTKITLSGPWSPIHRPETDSLNEIFQYSQLKNSGSVDADLMELLFESAERDMSIRQGFRGRPAIGATVLANAVDFADEAGIWKRYRDRMKAAGDVNLLLSGSVFGGSGAAGVPTMFRLLKNEIGDKLQKLRLGLILFLPYFQFQPIPGERIQADPSAFPAATAEALKYYQERGFLNMCQSIYTVGEHVPAEMTIAAVGAAEQRNEPHFIELIAGLGAVRFFGDSPGQDHSLAIAARRSEPTLTWDDLPTDPYEHAAILNKLQHMAIFAVAYRFIFYPVIMSAISTGKSNVHFWVDYIIRAKIPLPEAGKALRDVNNYVERFLSWLLRISTPRRHNFTAGLVNLSVFGVQSGNEWRLKGPNEFHDADFEKLLLNRPKAKFSFRSVFGKAGDPKLVRDDKASRVGRLVRALYEACDIN